jgi:hypothetical protein
MAAGFDIRGAESLGSVIEVLVDDRLRNVNEWMTVNDEIERIWKETVVACFKVLYRN